jgi:hypothetical protein
LSLQWRNKPALPDASPAISKGMACKAEGQDSREGWYGATMRSDMRCCMRRCSLSTDPLRPERTRTCCGSSGHWKRKSVCSTSKQLSLVGKKQNTVPRSCTLGMLGIGSRLESLLVSVGPEFGPNQTFNQWCISAATVCAPANPQGMASSPAGGSTGVLQGASQRR